MTTQIQEITIMAIDHLSTAKIQWAHGYTEEGHRSYAKFEALEEVLKTVYDIDMTGYIIKESDRISDKVLSQKESA